MGEGFLAATFQSSRQPHCCGSQTHHLVSVCVCVCAHVLVRACVCAFASAGWGGRACMCVCVHNVTVLVCDCMFVHVKCEHVFVRAFEITLRF
jgi:hypothetical protein